MVGNRAARREAMRNMRSSIRAQSAYSRYTPAAKPEPVVKIETQYDTIRIFRIEHPESKKGPFTHEGEARGLGPGLRFGGDAMVYMTEPSEFKGAGLGGYTGHIYAFISPDKMMACIDRFIVLRELGFYFQEWESSEHKVLPDGQVAFFRDKSKLIGEWPCGDFPFENYF